MRGDKCGQATPSTVTTQTQKVSKRIANLTWQEILLNFPFSYQLQNKFFSHLTFFLPTLLIRHDVDCNVDRKIVDRRQNPRHYKIRERRGSCSLILLCLIETHFPTYSAQLYSYAYLFYKFANNISEAIVRWVLLKKITSIYVLMFIQVMQNGMCE